MREREMLIQHAKNVIQEWEVAEGVNPGDPLIVDPDFGFTTGCKTIIVSAVDPKNLTSADLPAVFYGTGETTALPGTQYGTNFRGETYRSLLNAVFEKLTGDDLLIESAARMTDAVGQIARNMLNTPDDAPYVIDDVFLERSTPFSQGLSDREFIQYVLAINFYYQS